MSAIVTSLLPVFALIAMGAMLKRAKFPGEAFWGHAEKLSYFILFPAFLIHSLTTADLSGFDIGPMTLALFLSVSSIAALVALTRRLMGFSGAQYTSVFQAAVRWNGFVALAAIGSLYGHQGLAVAAVGFGVLVPTTNLMSVFVLTRHATAAPLTFRAIARGLYTNPLLIACLGGIAINAAGLTLPAPVAFVASMLGTAAVPVGLLVVGASLDLRAARGELPAILYGGGLKLIGMPLAMLGFCALLGVEGVARSVAVICGATPIATSAYILARQLGGDAVLMANLITATTIASAASLPILLFFLA